MIVSSTLVSVLSVLLVAIDRFLYILYGMQYQRYIFPNRARILIVTTWIIGELLAASCSSFALSFRAEKPFTTSSDLIKFGEVFFSTIKTGLLNLFIKLVFRLENKTKANSPPVKNSNKLFSFPRSRCQ